jgi:DNA-binding response OmpR family regulator
MHHLQKITLRAESEREALISHQDQLVEKKLVLIIDDSLTVRKIVETCLSREGFEVRGFQDGLETIRWLMEPGSRLPHLVILDINLPKMDGYEVARHLKSKPQFRDTVILLLTRRNGVLDRLKGRLVGAQAYITKPFQTQHLVSIVEAYLDIPNSTCAETNPYT